MTLLTVLLVPVRVRVVVIFHICRQCIYVLSFLFVPMNFCELGMFVFCLFYNLFNMCVDNSDTISYIVMYTLQYALLRFVSSNY
jgi:hypothetical protein